MTARKTITRIAAATPDELLVFVDRVLDAPDVDSVFAK